MALVDELPWHEQPVWRAVDTGEGWHDIIRRLHADLIVLDPDYKLYQVKEKMGGLRYYIATSHAYSQDDPVHARIAEAEREASVTCEECGEPGMLRQNGWWRTLCEGDNEGTTKWN